MATADDTRGAAETERLLGELLCDAKSMIDDHGVLLLKEEVDDICGEQKKHIKCI